MSDLPDYKPHSLLDYVPRHKPEELDDLEKTTRLLGKFVEPIRIAQTSEGERLIDGIGRQEISHRTGIVPEVVNLGTLTDDQIRDQLLARNTRRNLSEEQKVEMFLKLKPDWLKREKEQAQAEANQARSEKAREQIASQARDEAGKVKPGGAPHDARPGKPKNKKSKKVAAKLAREAGVSERTAERHLAKRNAQPRSVAVAPKWKKLRKLLASVHKTLESAAKLATELHAPEIAERLTRVDDAAHAVATNIETEFLGNRKGQDSQE